MLVLSIAAAPTLSFATITRADVESQITPATTLIGQLRACMSVSETNSYLPAIDTEVAFLQYIRTSDLLLDDYPEFLAKKIGAYAKLEMEQIRLFKDSPVEVAENCKTYQADARRLVQELKLAIQKHNSKRKK
ncbi:hypothetical protein LJR129_005079 [Acidovorax sp. LjRoot129]|uniref:hypothetical protein n=1 Tax=unclassified Acidovorax TaxID=2684926 RepID=UPI003ECEE364